VSLGRPGPTTRALAWEVGDLGARREDDTLATEEPLEIRLVHRGQRYPLAVTMRTPGADFELAVGFLFTEGVLTNRGQLSRVSYCVDKDVGEEQRFNIVNVELAATAELADLAPLERHFSVTSACGVCGKATLEGLRRRGLEPLPQGPALSPEVVRALPAKLRQAQALFDTTGGLHASGLFSADGEIVAVREDVGRHNAMDKLVGWAFLNDRLPLAGHVVLVSGRSSFELVQKSVSARVAALCSVSAPSSLAVDAAREFGLTLVGFLRQGRYKVYSGAEQGGCRLYG
jgi:FdhD protein